MGNRRWWTARHRLAASSRSRLRERDGELPVHFKVNEAKITVSTPATGPVSIECVSRTGPAARTPSLQQEGLARTRPTGRTSTGDEFRGLSVLHGRRRTPSNGRPDHAARGVDTELLTLETDDAHPRGPCRRILEEVALSVAEARRRSSADQICRHGDRPLFFVTVTRFWGLADELPSPAVPTRNGRTRRLSGRPRPRRGGLQGGPRRRPRAARQDASAHLTGRASYACRSSQSSCPSFCQFIVCLLGGVAICGPRARSSSDDDTPPATGRRLRTYRSSDLCRDPSFA